MGLDVIISEGAESNDEGHCFKAPLRSDVFSAVFSTAERGVTLSMGGCVSLQGAWPMRVVPSSLTS